MAIVLTRAFYRGGVSNITLTIVHGISGLVIFGLPIWVGVKGITPAGFSLVGVGGALIGLGGLLLFFMRAGNPLLSKQHILRIFPALLLLTTAAFVAGFVLVKR